MEHCCFLNICFLGIGIICLMASFPSISMMIEDDKKSSKYKYTSFWWFTWICLYIITIIGIGGIFLGIFYECQKIH